MTILVQNKARNPSARVLDKLKLRVDGFKEELILGLRKKAPSFPDR
jgi:hypothetical protein